MQFLYNFNKMIIRGYTFFKKIVNKILKYFFKIFSHKIDVFFVFGDHFNTLIKFNTDEFSIKDFFTFIIFPFILSFIFIFIFKGRLNENSVNSISISLSIFIPILFSFLIGILSLNNDDLNSNRQLEVLKQFKNNISFGILISLILLIIIWFKYLNIELFSFNLGLFSFITLYLLIVIFLNFIMVLKRLIFIIDGKLNKLKLR